jgi:hypothetical protein
MMNGPMAGSGKDTDIQHAWFGNGRTLVIDFFLVGSCAQVWQRACGITAEAALLASLSEELTPCSWVV